MTNPAHRFSRSELPFSVRDCQSEPLVGDQVSALRDWDVVLAGIRMEVGKPISLGFRFENVRRGHSSFMARSPLPPLRHLVAAFRATEIHPGPALLLPHGIFRGIHSICEIAQQKPL